MKKYKIKCDFNWSMEELGGDDYYYENVQGSPLIHYSTCVEVDHDESIAYNRGQLRILDLIMVPKDPPFEASPKLEKLRQELLARRKKQV